MKCIKCDVEIESARLKILPDTLFCSYCAKKVNTPRVKAAIVYYHKTAPELNIMPGEYYDTEWKRYNPKYGRGSGVHKFIKSIR